MFWRIIKGALIRQWKNMILIAFTVALGISLATAMMNVMLGVGDKVNKELKTYGANINVVPRNSSLLNDLYGLNKSDEINDSYLNENEILRIKTIFWGYNVVDFAPYLNQNIDINDKKIKAIGTWYDKHLNLSTGEEFNTGIKKLKTWWDIKGSWITDNDNNSVMVGNLLAKKNNINIGDNLNINVKNKNYQIKVKGIFTSGDNDDNNIYMSLSELQRIKELPNKISRVEVSALTTPDNDLAKRATQDPNSLTTDEYETWYCTAYVSSICYQIQEAIPDGIAKPIRQVAQSEGTILDKVQLLMTLLTILGSLGSALGISNLVTESVMEKSKEIGLLKAIGAQTYQIIILLLVEIMIIGIIGGIVGYLLGLGFSQIISQSIFGNFIKPALIVIPIDVVIVFLVIILGSIPSMNYLLQLKPTEVLHGK